MIFRGYLLATLAEGSDLALSRKERERNEDLHRLGRVLCPPTFLKAENQTERRRVGLEEAFISEWVS
jgi:hypothetical protein